MMQDIVELRKKDWVPRREDNNPKTIDQIHKEAAEKAKKTQMMIQMAKQDKKLRGEPVLKATSTHFWDKSAHLVRIVHEILQLWIFGS